MRQTFLAFFVIQIQLPRIKFPIDVLAYIEMIKVIDLLLLKCKFKIDRSVRKRNAGNDQRMKHKF